MRLARNARELAQAEAAAIRQLAEQLAGLATTQGVAIAAETIAGQWATDWAARLVRDMEAIWNAEMSIAIEAGPQSLTATAERAADRAERAAARHGDSQSASAKRSRTIARNRRRVADEIRQRLATVRPVAPDLPASIDGHTIQEWTRRTGRRASELAVQTGRRGAATSRAPATIRRTTRLLVGRHTRRAVLAVSRMAATHATAHAHLRIWRDSGARVVVYTAILDSITSAICRALSGRRWKPGSPNIRVPPQHPGCRSTLAPVYGDGSPPVSYDRWLKEQSKARQDRILGPSRGVQFRNGRSLRDMVRLDDGRLKPLAPGEIVRR